MHWRAQCHAKWRNPIKEHYKERSNIKSASVSALTGSVPRKMAEEQQRFSAPRGNRTRAARLWLTLTTKPWVCVSLQRKWYATWRVTVTCFATCNPLFWGQDCRSQIAQVEYQGQARKTRILESKPLIDTSYRIRHRFELKYFHFAQIFLIASGRVIDAWSVTQQMIVYNDKLPKKSSNRKSKLVLSTLVTTCLSNLAFHLRPIGLQTLVATDS